MDVVRSFSEGLVLALVGAAFGAGGFAAWVRGRLDEVTRAVQRAHLRIDELEQQTGTHTVLRAEAPEPAERRHR